MRKGFFLLARSRVFHSAAMGCEPGAPDFRNISVLGVWNGTPCDLLRLCQSIEEECGRPNHHPHMVSRTLDIDLLVCGSLIQKDPTLTLPHPEIRRRDFVLIPSAEIAPDLPIPGTGLTFRDLLSPKS